MTKTVSIIAFILGAAVVLWMGGSFIHSNPLALLVTILIALAYTTGFVELLRYQQATGSLSRALNELQAPVDELNPWLGKLAPSLRFPVRQRIFGEAIGLPAPLLTPYLVGLLVMLGLLGTFIGMVETLRGAVGALQGSTELEAVREGLAAPIQGLGMAFATSVAGVTASAMLGLISTLSRRDRLDASRQLDAEMAGAFKKHSLTYQRRQTFEVLQMQSAAFPAVANQLGELSQQLDQRMQTLVENLSNSQSQLQQNLSDQYQTLSQSFESAMSQGIRESGRLAAESAQPIFQEFFYALARESRNSQEQLGKLVEQQVATISEQLNESGKALGQQWQTQFEENVSQLQQTTEAFTRQNHQATQASQAELNRLLAQGQSILDAQQQRDSELQSATAQGLRELIESSGNQLEALRQEEQARGEAAADRLTELQESSAQQLAKLGTALEQPMARLIETASEAPRAAAEVIEQLRGEITKNIERDNTLLEERQQTLSQMESLSRSLEENARLQREAVQALLESSSDNLAAIAQQFGEKVASESHSLNEQMAHFSTSAVELSAVAEVFNSAIQQFEESNKQLSARLEQMESALTNAGQRSDEQMEYYLAQAREIIDYNLVSQQELLGHVRELNGKSESA